MMISLVKLIMPRVMFPCKKWLDEKHKRQTSKVMRIPSHPRRIRRRASKVVMKIMTTMMSLHQREIRKELPLRKMTLHLMMRKKKRKEMVK